MKFVNWIAAIIMAATLAACGGGGGGSDSSSTSPATTVSVTCPDGTSAAACPAIVGNFSGIAGSMSNGILVKLSGTVDPAKSTAVIWQGAAGGQLIAGTSALAPNNKDLSFTPTVRLASGQTYTFVVTATDSVGRPVSLTMGFGTEPMSCANNAVWSNPATFSPALADCVAPIGVQTLMSPVNTMTDASCVFTVGAAMTSACKAYAANGTLVFANTGVTVNNAAMLWVAYIAKDGTSNLVLVDATTLSVVAKTVLATPMVWIIGNPTGANYVVNVGGVQRQYHVDATLATTCTVNC